MKYYLPPTLRGYQTEALSGITVALALVPEAVAFAFIAFVHPLVGLYGAFFMCLITAAFGGRPGMISGATGALAVVMAGLVLSHGTQYLFAAVVLMGILQLLAGAFRLGKFIRLVPYPAILGFVNGLAIVIFLAQLQNFKDPATSAWLSGYSLYTMGALVLMTMLVIHYAPRLIKGLPGPFMGIVFCSAVVIFLGIHTITVRDLASIAGGLPSFEIPIVPMTWETLYIIFPYSFILAAIGLIESLLTMTLIDDITQTYGRNSQECLAQGAGNVISGFFGAMGGCAMIGQSMINIKSGARYRLSGIVAALCLLAFILFLAPYIEMIPLAALVAVMFIVVISTFKWASLKILHRIPLTDALVMVTVTIVTVFTDLAVAVIIGVIISALAFSWKAAHHMSIEVREDKPGHRTYELFGVLFFGSTATFKAHFNPEQDPQDVTLDFKEARILDHSALEAIEALAVRYQAAGTTLHLRHLSPDCKHLLTKAGAIIEHESDDPNYQVFIERDCEAGSSQH